MEKTPGYLGTLAEPMSLVCREVSGVVCYCLCKNDICLLLVVYFLFQTQTTHATWRLMLAASTLMSMEALRTYQSHDSLLMQK